MRQTHYDVCPIHKLNSPIYANYKSKKNLFSDRLTKQESLARVSVVVGIMGLVLNLEMRELIKFRKFEIFKSKTQKNESNNLTFKLMLKVSVKFKPKVWDCSQLLIANRSKKTKQLRTAILTCLCGACCSQLLTANRSNSHKPQV